MQSVFEAAGRDWKAKWAKDHKNELPFYSIVGKTYWFGTTDLTFMQLEKDEWFDDVRIVFAFDS